VIPFELLYDRQFSQRGTLLTKWVRPQKFLQVVYSRPRYTVSRYLFEMPGFVSSDVHRAMTLQYTS
jgi:hypothetical protein